MPVPGSTRGGPITTYNASGPPSNPSLTRVHDYVQSEEKTSSRSERLVVSARPLPRELVVLLPLPAPKTLAPPPPRTRPYQTQLLPFMRHQHPCSACFAFFPFSQARLGLSLPVLTCHNVSVPD